MMKKGDKVTINGQPYICEWTSEDMTEKERMASADRALELLDWAGIPPVSPDLLAAQERKSKA
jgi:hypothetical protein